MEIGVLISLIWSGVGIENCVCVGFVCFERRLC